MRPNRNLGKLSTIALVMLAMLAVGLSVAALLSTRPISAEPAGGPASSIQASQSIEPATGPSPDSEPPSPAPTSEASAGEPSTQPPEEALPSETDESLAGGTVVVIGDSYSVGDDTWVSTAAEALGWGKVVNLSSPGRGYLVPPRSCDFEPCDRFRNSVSAIVDTQPDVVVTFGGTADGDYALDSAPADYFEALREELPDAELVAINPVTGDSPAPYWLTLHAQTIRAGVEAVDGTFVNVGQPGAGDGDTLSDEAQDAIAQAIVDALS